MIGETFEIDRVREVVYQVSFTRSGFSSYDYDLFFACDPYCRAQQMTTESFVSSAYQRTLQSAFGKPFLYGLRPQASSKTKYYRRWIVCYEAHPSSHSFVFGITGNELSAQRDRCLLPFPFIASPDLRPFRIF